MQLLGSEARAAMKRPKLGSWTCPSGNRVDVFLGPESQRPRTIALEWDAPPPLAADDELYYVAIIRPAVVQRIREYLELPGRAAMVTLR
jgi:hypothetical protein